MNDIRYQKRKLNRCCVSGCQDRVLRLEFTEQGGCMFICRTHGFLLDCMMQDVEKIRAKMRSISDEPR